MLHTTTFPLKFIIVQTVFEWVQIAPSKATNGMGKFDYIYIKYQIGMESHPT